MAIRYGLTVGLLAVTLTAAGCAGVTATSIADKSIAAVEQSLTVLEKAALQYTSMPPCGATLSRVCSDPSIKAQIKAADMAAYTAVAAAAANRGSLDAAMTALDNLRRAIPTL